MIKTFKMKLYPGMEEEYERRHNELWPEMIDMIHAHGGRNYTIALDPDTLTLFGYIEIDDPERWAAGADTAINRKWWDFMADIMGDQRGQLAGLRRPARAVPHGLGAESAWCEQALRPGHPTA